MKTKPLTPQQLLERIRLRAVQGSTQCLYSVIENKLADLYYNQTQLLAAIKLLGTESKRRKK